MDYIVRATAADAQIRAFAATTRDLTEHARQVHNTSPVVTAALGRLMTGAVMMGKMLKGEDDLLTLQISGDGPLKGMTVTADSRGHVKGYAIEPQIMLPPSLAGKLDVGGAIGNGFLRVIKDMGLKEPYVGQTGLQSGEIAGRPYLLFCNVGAGAVQCRTRCSDGKGQYREAGGRIYHPADALYRGSGDWAAGKKSGRVFHSNKGSR